MAKKLYVGNLSYETSDETLAELFKEFNATSVNIIRYADTGRSKGFGFAEFENDEDADKAVEALNGKDFEGRSLVVNVAKPKEEGDTAAAQPGNKLYVGNLSYDVDEGGLKDAFGKFGEIEEATIIRFPDTGKSKGFGFVVFKTVEEAEKALEMNGQELDGRNIVVNMAKPKERNGGRGGRNGGDRRGGNFRSNNNSSFDDSYGDFF